MSIPKFMWRFKVKGNEIVSVQEQKQLQLLNNGLITADKFINKNYLIDLAQHEVLPLNENEKTTNAIRLLKVERLVFDKEENINDKLISVYSALQDIQSTALLIIDGNGDEITYYIGVRAIENAAVASKILEKSFTGNFSGSILKGLKNAEIECVMDKITQSQYSSTARNVSCVTVVPSMRDEDKEKFVQGLEKFIDTMQGEKYTALFIARPVSKGQLEEKKRGYEEIYSVLSPFAKTSLAYGENSSKAVTKGMFENFSQSINNSITNTTGYNTSKNTSYTIGHNSSSGVSDYGFTTSRGKNTSKTTGYSSGQSWSNAVTRGTTDTTGSGKSTSDTDTIGNSKTLTIEHQNKSVITLLETVDRQLERIKDCEAFGVWECASYFIADDIQTSVVAANAYKALMIGEDTSVENSFVNVWGVKTPKQTKEVLEYMKYGINPVMVIEPEEGFQKQFVTPTNFISGKELPLLMGLPQKSVTGLTVSNIAEFGRNVFVQGNRLHEKQIQLGKVYHMGNTENNQVQLDLDSFTSHCFITGSTGSGKSNTTYCLLEEFYKHKIPFLVIEPAKGEYKTAFGNIEGINVFTTNPLYGQMLKINPFRFDKNIHVLEHLDRLIEIFNACWEMYAAMPAILKEAIEKIYINKGWDLLNSIYVGEGEVDYPTFDDLLKMLPNVIGSSSYSSDTKGDYTGALVTRVASLTNGISGQIFCDSYDLPDTVLFDENTIVDLSRVGSTETKSLIMGILILKLTEYRMANATEANQGLRHITVLEEAHNLLKNTSNGGVGGSNVVAKSVEMICNSIAEMRTYGEGFVIVDQSPTAVDIAAIKNTNTKILMRLPEKNDCEAVGNAVGLKEEQIKELAKLGTGIAVVMQNNWLESVLTHINAFSNAYEKQYKSIAYEEIRIAKGKIIHELMMQYIEERKMNLERMLILIDGLGLNEDKKKEIRICVKAIVNYLAKGRDIHYFARSLLNLAGCKNLFDILDKDIIRKKEGDTYTYDQVNLKEWRDKLEKEMRRYIELPDHVRKLLVQYLIHAKRIESREMDYGRIYDELYK